MKFSDEVSINYGRPCDHPEEAWREFCLRVPGRGQDKVITCIKCERIVWTSQDCMAR